MCAEHYSLNHCLIPELNHPSNLAFRRYHRIVLLQRFLPVLADMLSAEQLVDVSSELEMLYWPALGRAQSPCFFEVPAFLGSVTPDQPMEPAVVFERLMALPCPPLPLDVAPVACNLERLGKQLDLSAVEQLHLLCAYLNYGGGAWPYLQLPERSQHALLATWWATDLAAVNATLNGRLGTLRLLELPSWQDSDGTQSLCCTLAALLPMSADVVRIVSQHHTTDAALLNALQHLP